MAAALGIAGCSAADGAILGASGCSGGDAAARPADTVPGSVYAWQPHFGAEGAAGPVPGWTDVVSLASTGRTTYAVRADGTVWAYGQGQNGSLGDGDLSRHAVETPQQVLGIADARSVQVVGSAAFVVTGDGAVVGWGDGLLAHGGEQGTVNDHAASPIPIDGLDGVAAIAESSLTALALRRDGTVAGWGINLTDMLGDRDGTELTTVGGVSGVVSLAASRDTAIAATAAGVVCAWGGNDHDLLGPERVSGQSGDPAEVRGVSGVEQVAAGDDTAFALDGSGAVWAWGRGVYGLLGDGNAEDHVSAVPRRVEGLPQIRWIGASGLTGYAIDVDGGLWGWGSGLALGTDGAAVRPVRIPLPGPAITVSGSHTIVGAA